jgi:hypothetical protein
MIVVPGSPPCATAKAKATRGRGDGIQRLINFNNNYERENTTTNHRNALRVL